MCSSLIVQDAFQPVSGFPSIAASGLEPAAVGWPLTFYAARFSPVSTGGKVGRGFGPAWTA